MSMQNVNLTEQELSQEEIEIRKEEMLTFYKEQIEFMKVQHEFERLSSEIEEYRLRRLVSMIRQAEIQSPPENQEEGSSETSEGKNTNRPPLKKRG